MGASFLKESAMSKDSPAEISNLLQEIESLKERVTSLERQARSYDVPLEKVDDLFNLMFEKLSDDEIRRLFRELDTSTLATAACGLDLVSLGRIRGNLSANAWLLFIDEINYQSHGSLYSSSARQRVLKVARQLLSMGLLFSEELYMAMIGDEFDRRFQPLVPPTNEERAAAEREEAERKIKHEQWLKTLVHVKPIKKPEQKLLV
jgi:hypothetical protein